ncbi:MAG: peptide chain release factor N(5)-glutamine methyltransferase [Holosporales bacterium]|jgi:release factor glutamine methyltransferase|nr:peptide chain release factor N(5)-glutamine methyltransferase [Holosporales bacterium]
MHLNTALKIARDILSIVNFKDDAEFFAKNLLSYLTGIDIKQLFLNKRKILSVQEVNKYLAALKRGVQGEPVSKIFNRRYFWRNEFYVNKDVLDPRPDSEVIIESVLNHFIRPNARILDLGTGSGCLLLTLLKEIKCAYGIGVDVSQNALNAAIRNAKSIGVIDRANFICGSWGEMLASKFDIIVANPPYIPTRDIAELSKNVKGFDPHIALNGGEDGLSCYREIAKIIRGLLDPQIGAAFIEIGMGQAESVKIIFEDNDCSVKQVFKDLSGTDRCLKIQR